VKLEFPDALAAKLEGYEAQAISTGMSGAGVYRLRHASLEPLFLKCIEVSELESLNRDAAVLRWLDRHAVRVPRVEAFVVQNDLEWLLTSTVPGRDASSAWSENDVGRVITALASGLKRLHALPIHDCPFDRRLEVTRREAAARVQANAVDEDDFDERHLGSSAEALLDLLESSVPDREDLVFTHGDYCVPNVLIDSSFEVGFIDLGRAGIADRYQDLALMTRSLESDLNPQFNGWSEVFLERYGITAPNRSKLEFYRLLDEFF
jgi:aminoglycoside phosphotransferase